MIRAMCSPVHRAITYLVIVLSLVLTASCSGGYSFTGASIPAEARTLSLQQFPNYATSVNPQLSQKMYDKLQQRFSSQTRLNIIEEDGDLQITGEITDYRTATSSISSTDNAATNRLTITVKVKFVNIFDSKANFSQSFTRYKDYSAERDFSSVEASLMGEIVNELCEDIFNKAVVNW